MLHVTPAAMPARSVTVPMVKPVYTTATGDAPRPQAPARRRDGIDAYDDFSYCFVCHRPTDHVGEHDALVEAGMAVYEANGSVVRTAAYDTDKAREIADAEYAEYVNRLGL